MSIRCTPSIATALVSMLATGVSIRAAAAHVGLGEDIVRYWIERGRAAERGKLRALAIAADAARREVRARVESGGPLVTVLSDDVTFRHVTSRPRRIV